MKSNTLIAQIEPPERTDSGDYYYRTHAPGIAMSQESDIIVINTTNVHREKAHIMDLADVLILVNLCDPDLLPIIRNRKSNKKLTVYEMADDVSALQEWNAVYQFYENKENLSLVYRLARECDALQVTVPELKRIYGRLNENCIVFPNQISYVPSPRSSRRNGEIVIGWGGSHGHLEDMAGIARPLIDWLSGKPNVKLHLMCSNPIRELFSEIAPNKISLTPPGPIEEYYAFLSHIDIGLGPLENTAFNRSRSDVKFLEYAVSGVVPVMARLEPYQNTIKNNETGLLYKDTWELISLLERLVTEASLIERISQSARQYVLDERLQTERVRDRIDFYRGLSWDLYGRNPGRSLSCERYDKWAQYDGAKGNGRHLKLEGTLFENLLYHGLVLMQDNGKYERAKACFNQAEALQPKNYLPHLFSTPISPNPVDSLKKAIGLNPNSLKAWIMLGEAYSNEGNVSEAFKSFDAAAKILPDYEVPYNRAADLLLRIGENAKADILLQKVDQLDPFNA